MKRRDRSTWLVAVRLLGVHWRLAAVLLFFAAVLTGCITRDRKFYYVNERTGRVQFYDSQAQKWQAHSGSTARFFICQDSNLHSYAHKRLVISPEAITHARNSPDCRPAIDDPEGHWGKPLEGAQLGVRFGSVVFTAGQPILATLITRNISDREMYIEGRDPNSLSRDVQLTVMDASQNLVRKDELQNPTNFLGRLRLIKNNGALQVAPGFQRKEFVDLNSLFELRPGAYTFSASRSVYVAGGAPSNRVHSGTAIIRVVEASAPVD